MEDELFGCWKGMLLGIPSDENVVTTLRKGAKALVAKYTAAKSVSKRDVQLMEVCTQPSVETSDQISLRYNVGGTRYEARSRGAHLPSLVF